MHHRIKRKARGRAAVRDNYKLLQTVREVRLALEQSRGVHEVADELFTENPYAERALAKLERRRTQLELRLDRVADALACAFMERTPISPEEITELLELHELVRRLQDAESWLMQDVVLADAAAGE